MPVNAKIKVFLTLFLFLIISPTSPQEDGGALQKVVASMNSLHSFQADVTISSPSSGLIRGSLAYQQGKIQFALSDGRIIASDGRTLTIYNPSTRVAGKQEMYSRGGGIGWILNGFNAKVTGNRAHLTAQSPDRGIQEVHLEWTPNYLLRSISIRYKDSANRLIISFTKIALVKNISVNRFSWHPPAGSRTVENPLNQRN